MSKISFNTLQKILLVKNSKVPAQKNWHKNLYKTVYTNYYNVGIPCGLINNLLVLDIDEKDNGSNEWEKYVKEYGEPLTVKQTTPNNGFHLIFNFSHNDPACSFLINEYLKNKTKFRGVGLDIRANGGYICAEPSTIDGKAYKFIRSFENYEVLDMPESLINWLCVGQITNKTTLKTPVKIPKTSFNITNENLKEYLDMLPDKYLNNFSDWLKILAICKNLEQFDIFDEWSKNSDKYNKLNNLKLWKKNNGVFNINYLLYLIKIECGVSVDNKAHGFKAYIPISKPISFNVVAMSNKYLFDSNYNGIQFDTALFNNYETIIIKSTTGTGKTTATAKHCAEMFKLNKEEPLKVISIVPRISLAQQHVSSFNSAGVKLFSYINEDNKTEFNLNTDNIVICINSLLKLDNLPINIINNSIIYIDEITSFLECLTHNDLLNNKLKQIYTLLIKLVTNCKKIIVSDALISDNVFEFLKYRADSNKVYLENSFLKFENVIAVRLFDENVFMEKLAIQIFTNEPFLCCSDSCAEITKLYIKMLSGVSEELKFKFMLITSDTKIKITNASEQFKDKFVFYSPSITYGVDFQSYQPQNVFSYIKGASIQPSGFFQQVTRTRNIKKLYYYCHDHSEEPKYNNISDVTEYFSNVVNITENNIFNICINSNEKDEITVNKNIFFNLYCYNSYVFDTYASNKLTHFEKILEENGFKLSVSGKKRALKWEVKEKMTEELEIYREDIYNQFLKATETEREAVQFSKINEHFKTFKLNEKTPEELAIIKTCITDEYYFNEVLNFNRLLKSEEYITTRVNISNNVNYKIKNYNGIYKKIQLFQHILKINNLNMFQLDIKKNAEINLPDDIFKQYKIIYNSPKATQPTNPKMLISFLVDTYRLLMPKLKLISTEIKQIKNKDGTRTRLYEYTINNDTVSNINKILKIYGFIKKEETAKNIHNFDRLEFIDETEPEEMHENYNKHIDRQFLLGDVYFKYFTFNNVNTCAHCKKGFSNLSEHCVSCEVFKIPRI